MKLIQKVVLDPRIDYNISDYKSFWNTLNIRLEVLNIELMNLFRGQTLRAKKVQRAIKALINETFGETYDLCIRPRYIFDWSEMLDENDAPMFYVDVYVTIEDIDNTQFPMLMVGNHQGMTSYQ